MRESHLDNSPGPLPQIRAVIDGIVFEFDETSGEQGARLVIRCDEEGNVLASITPADSAWRRDAA